MRTSPSSWSNTLTKLGLRRTQSCRPRCGASYRRRSSIEHLEDRNLLSLTVNTVEDENDGYDVGNRSLREAIAEASQTAVDTIEFDASLNGKTIELSLGQITIDRNVNIIGSGAGLLSVDANGSEATASRIFTVNANKTVTISGLTLTGGHVTGTSDGGAIHNSGTLKLDHIVLANNQADDFGGAIYNNGGFLEIVDSTIEANAASRGAGIYYNRGTGVGNLTIINSAVLSNDAGSFGGGLFVYSFSDPHATASIINSTFSGNTAQHGAAIITDGGPTVEIINSTITANAASQQGGGIRKIDGAANVILQNTILAGNSAGISDTRNLAGTLSSSSAYNLVGLGNSAGLNPSVNQLGVSESDLRLGPLDYYGGPTKTHALLPGSPAIDGGDNDNARDSVGTLLGADQRGFTRFVDIDPTGPATGTVDIGAVEWHRPVAIGDFDGDGRDDEAFLAYGTALYVASKPSGKLQISKWGTLPSTEVAQWQVGDFNGDGRDDLAFRTTDYLKLWYMAFSESTSFVITPTGFGFNEWQIALTGDFDGDGRDELIGRYDTNDSDSTPDTWSLIDYDAAGHFTQYDIGTVLANPFYAKVHAGDVNSDGRDDLVTNLGGGSWGVALTALDADGRVLLPTMVTNVGNWFRDDWVNDVGGPTESVDIEDPYRRLLEIFSEVYNTIELELYPGLMKGIQATAETKAGNPWDQAALLVDRLDTEGFQSKIVYGTIDAPLNEVREWLGVTSNSAAWSVIRASLDATADYINGGTSIRFKHAWVQVNVPTASGMTPVYLDPSWKFKDRQPGEAINLANAGSGYLPPTFGIDGRTARGTFDEFGYLADAGDNQLPLEWYEDQVMKYLVDTGQYKSLAEVAYDGPIHQKIFTAVPNVEGKLLGSSAVKTPLTNPETFENLGEILNSTELKNRFVHQATISLAREVDEGPRIVPFDIPANVGDEFPSNDVESPVAEVVNPASSSIGGYVFLINNPGPNDSGNTTASNGVRRISGTKHITISIPNPYPITLNTRLQISYNSNAPGHSLIYGWDEDNYRVNDSNERVAGHTILASPYTLALFPLEEHTGVNASKVVLGLRHENHSSGASLTTDQWIDITDIRFYEVNTGEAVVEDLSGFKTVRQTGGHFFSLDVSELGYEVTEDSILLVEYDQQGNSGPNLLGWDIDNVSSNDTGQVSNLFSLHGSVSGYAQAVHIEYLPDGFRRMYLPIGQELAAGQSAPLYRLLFYTDYPLNPSNPNVMLFRNFAISTSRVGAVGEHWTSGPLAMPQVSLSSITIDYAKEENNHANQFDDTYKARLLIDGAVIEQGVGDEVFQDGDTSKIQIQHLSPSEFGIVVPQNVADQTFTREANQVHAIGFDANQFSREHLIRLQAGLTSLLVDGDDESDIDELLTYASAKYWHDFNQSSETIDDLLHTVGARQWVGSGMVTADRYLIGGDLSHLNFPIAPLNMGVDWPNAVHASIDIQTGNISDEAFQLVFWNGSSLENAVVEELINAESVSTVRGLKYAFHNPSGIQNDGDSVRILESIGNSSGPPSIYFRGAIGDNAGSGIDHPNYVGNATNRPIVRVQKQNSSDQQSLEYWIGDLSINVLNDIWAALNEADGLGDTVRVIAPRLSSMVGEEPLAWKGAVYVAEVDTSTTKSGLYAIVPFDGSAPSSGGYSGNKIEPDNLSRPKLNHDQRGFAGDPVSLANGNLFRDEVDIAYSNLGVPLSFTRHYESGSKYDVGLGVGWVHSFSDRLLQDPDDLNTIEWLTSDGTLVKFTKSGGVWKAPASRFGEFTNTGTTFVWRGADGMEYHFAKVSSLAAGEGKDYIARLEKIVDRDGHGVQLTYDAVSPFKLTQAQDIHDASRRLDFTYNGSNRITSVTRVVLGAITGTWIYAYNTGSGQPPAGTRLTKVTTPSDAQTAAHETYYEYYTSGPSMGLISKIIEPDGGYHKYEYYANGRVFRVTESIDTKGTPDESDDVTSTQSFNYNLFRELTEFTDENGNVETYHHDEKGQLLRQVHDDRSRLIYEYGTEANNESALMLKATDERGLIETFDYYRSGETGYQGRSGELQTHVAKDGTITNFEYWSHPFISELTKTVVNSGSAVIITQYGRDSLGHLTSVTDALGNRTDYTYYDASDPLLRGLRKSETRPMGVAGPEAVTWEVLSNNFVVTGNTLSVRLWRYDNGKTVSADAIRIDRVNLDGTFTRIVDDDWNGATGEIDPNFRVSHSTGFVHSTNQTQPRYEGEATTIDAGGVRHATWVFTDLQPGTYRVSTTWIYNSTRDPNANYQLFDGLPGQVSPTTVIKNQTVAPSGFHSYETVFNYDAAGNLISAITEQLPAGIASYDHFGKVASSTDAAGIASFAVQDILGRTLRAGLEDLDGPGGPLSALATTFVYDPMGRLVNSTDALGRVTSSDYDLKGRLIKLTFADSTSMEYGYDGKGNRTSVTDELGHKTTFVYDSRDRVIQTIHPDGAIERVQYDGAGNVTETVDSLGRRTVFTYDKAGRLLTIITAADTSDQIQTINKYDTLGRLVETVDPNSIITQYKHDALGRVVQTTVLDDQHVPATGSALTTPSTSRAPIYVSTVKYDANGRATEITVFDPTKFSTSDYAALINNPTSLITPAYLDADKVRITTTSYDSFDRPVGMTYADGSTTSTIYDAAGKTRFQVDELGRRTESVYDEYGRLRRMISPNPDGLSSVPGPTTEYHYDDAGNIVTIVDPRGFTTTREYDARNRLVAETDGVGAVRKTTYDVAGQPVAAIDPRGFAAWTRYDDRGRVILERLVDPDGTGVATAPTTSYTYDDVGNLKTTTDPLGNTVSFEYDALNRLRSESHYETLVADDEAGNDAMFSATAGASQISSSSQYGRGYTLWDDGTDAEATWTFHDLESGAYRVAMTWPVDWNATSAEVAIYLNDNPNPIYTSAVNQNLFPNDFFTAQGNHDVGWEILDSGVAIGAGGTLKIVLSGVADHSLVADAVRIGREVSKEYAYDDNGNLIASADTLGNVTGQFYDELNRNFQTISADPDGTSTTLASLVTERFYDGYGNVVKEQTGHLTSSSTYDLRRTDTFEYDQRNRLTKEIIDAAGASPLNITTEYEYDAVGNTTLVTDAEEFQTHYRYDNLNRQTDEYQDFEEGQPAETITMAPATIGAYAADGIFMPSNYQLSGDGKSISLSGNAWKTVSINHLIQHNTILEFDLQSDAEALVHMIGFDTDNTQTTADYRRVFELGGAAAYESEYHKDFRREVLTDGTVKFHIPIGQYLTEQEKLTGLQIDRLVLVNWETRSNLDPLDQGKSTFSNIRLYESDEVRSVTTYDAAGNVLSVREASDPRNIVTRYEYDGVGRQTREILDAGGSMERSYTTVYDASGNVLIERNDTAGTETVHQYDSLNRLTKTTLPDPDGDPATTNNLKATYQYNAAGQVIRTMNGELEKTYTDYDALGRAIAETDGNGDQTHYRYDSEGNLQSVTDAEENVTSYTYDSLNRLKTDTNAFGTRTHDYDNNGNLKSSTDRIGRIRQFTYDTLDRRTQEEWKTTNNSTSTHYLSWQYDDLNRITKQTDSADAVLGDANDLVDTFEYDGLGRLTAEANYDSTSAGRPLVQQTFDYTFDLEFNPQAAPTFYDRVYLGQNVLVGSTNVPIAVTRHENDRLARFSKFADWDADSAAQTPVVAYKEFAFTYDLSGNLNLVDRQPGSPVNSNSTSFEYDKASRLTSITHDLATDIVHNYTYDNASRITSFNSTGSSTFSRTHGYDDAGQLTSTTGNSNESYVYDDNGNRKSVNGQNVVVGAGNRLLEDESYDYTYDAEGNLTRRTDKSTGVATVYTWDHRNRLTGIETVPPPPSALTFPTSGGFSGYTGQGGTGNLTVEDNGKTLHFVGQTWRRIELNDLGLPTYYELTPDTVLSFDFYTPAEPAIAAIGLDNASNAINDPKRHIQVAGTTTTGTFAGIPVGTPYEGGWQHYEIRLADIPGYAEYQGSGFDDYWRRFTFINHGSGESYLKNIRLHEATPSESIDYVYDAQDRRVKRVHDADGAGTSVMPVNEYFVYDGDDLSMRFNGAGNLSHRYLYGPLTDQVLADESFYQPWGAFPEVYWLLGDHQGTIRDIVDGNGSLVKHTNYDSFGNITDPPPPPEAIDQLFHFAGQERDEATGWQLHGARWYMPETGRFASEDPVADDVNLYRYAGNSPVLYVDPTGLFTQLPTSYLPALAGNVTGFGRGTASPTALDLAYSNFDAPTYSSSWNAVGNALGRAAYTAATNYLSPITRAAVGTGVAFASSTPLIGQLGRSTDDDGYVRELVPNSPIVPTRPEDLPLYIQRARRDSDSYQLPIISHQGQGYLVPGRDGSVRFVTDEAVLPIATRQQTARNDATAAAQRAAFMTLVQEGLVALSPIHETGRDLGVLAFRRDFVEPNEHISTRDQVDAAFFLFMPGGNSGQARRADDILDYVDELKNLRVRRSLPQQQGHEFRTDQLELYEFDPNAPAHVRGFLKNERRRVEQGLPGPATPPGYELSHGRNTPAREGYDYSNSQLQGTDLNRLEEKIRRQQGRE